MSKSLAHYVPRLREHLSDDRLASLSCNEVSWFDGFVARRHLAECRACRMQFEDLKQRAERVMSLFRDEERQTMPARAHHRGEHLKLCYERIADHALRQRWFARWSPIRLLESHKMDAALITTMVLAVCTLMSALFWMQQRKPNITSNALLQHAETWDKGPTGSGVVIRQVVRIEARKQTTQHSIYRDAQGKRRPRLVRLTGQDEQLKSQLATAGIEWDAPLSAASYQAWHDQQESFQDRIDRTGQDLLTLRTKAADGPVAEQTLTVRETDFHPVRRTVEFRDSETVEIAEVDYKVLPWSAVDQSLFDPLMSSGSSVAGARIIPFPKLPEMLTAEQVDEAELGARLVLNQLHADTNEQLDITRSSKGVTVQGWVETRERRSELEEKLRLVPHVAASIRSGADLKDSEGIADVGTGSMPDHVSPLEIFLEAHGGDQNSARELSQRLFNSALTAGQESRAIDDLEERFDSDKLKTVIASATLSELVFTHRERLESALEDERRLLDQVSVSSGAVHGVPAPGSEGLLSAAETNLTLCKELIATDAAATRPAEAIVAELRQTLAKLAAEEGQTRTRPRGVVSQDGKD